MDQRINPVNLPLMSRPKIRELANMSSSGEKIDPNVEGILVKIAEDFISKVTQSSADLARHRKSKILDVEDVQLHLERVWDLGIPGYGPTEPRKSSKPPVPSDAHVQKMGMVQTAKIPKN